MSRKQRSDTELRKQNSIIYPRKCESCDYVSNNPSMFHYHKKTHYPVEGKICEYGCGMSAKFVSTKEIYCCSKNHMQCPSVRKEIADKVTNQWAAPDADERRVNAEKTFRKAVHNVETVAKATNTKWAKWGMENATAAQWKEFRKYGRSCRKLSQKWARDNGHELGQKTFHVDHIYSIMDGFKNKVSPLIVSHPANLRILEAKKNSSKGAKSEITLAELLGKIDECNQNSTASLSAS